MSMLTRSLRIACAGLMISAVAAWASPTGSSTIEGDVKDAKAQPVSGAEVHSQAKDGSGFYRIVHTDANGHYAVSKLPNTDYEVILFVNGSINSKKVPQSRSRWLSTAAKEERSRATRSSTGWISADATGVMIRFPS